MTEETKANASLDLRGVVCPINFVKAKLKLDMLETGEVLELMLDSGEPIQNVPKSIKEEGHKILEVKKLDGYFSLKVQKG